MGDTSQTYPHLSHLQAAWNGEPHLTNLCPTPLANLQPNESICLKVLRLPFLYDSWSVYGVLVAIYTVSVELWSVPCGLEGQAVWLKGWMGGVMSCEMRVCVCVCVWACVCDYHTLKLTTEIKQQNRADAWNTITKASYKGWFVYFKS